MSKITVAKGLQGTINMSNMSAQIVRKMVFNLIKGCHYECISWATKYIRESSIILSGEIPDRLRHNDYCGHFFVIRNGRLELLPVESKFNWYENIHLTLEGEDSPFVLLITTDGKHEPHIWVTVFKSPDYKMIKEKAIARWEQWLNE